MVMHGVAGTRVVAHVGKPVRPGPRVERARSDGHLDINWRTHANGPPAAPLTTVLRRPR